MAVSINIELEGFSDSVTIRKLTGNEEISTCYNYDVIVEIKAESVDSFKPIGKSATLHHFRDDAETNSVNAKVAQCVQLTDPGLPADKARYSLQLVPDLWMMGLTERTKIYIDQTLTDILADQFEAGAIAHEASEFSGALYTEKPLVTQYRESGLNFVNRILEDRGVYYYFDHNDNGKLIISDSISYYGDVVELDVNAEIEPGTWTGITRMAPTMVRLSGYDVRQPNEEIVGESQIEDDFSFEVHVNDEPLLDAEEAMALAQVRLEQLRMMSDYVTFRSFVSKLSPGRQFTKGGTDYLVTKVHHTYVHEDTSVSDEPNHYRNTVTAIRSDILYRPSVRAIKPCAAGTEIAHIHSDTDNELAMLDEDGLYTVVLNYVSDSSDPPLSKLRMQQPATGEDDGFYFPLKDGVEVVIAFKKGNPDLPYIHGAMSHGELPSPVNADNSHHSVIKAKHLLSLQSKGGLHQSFTAKGSEADDHKFEKLKADGTTDLVWKVKSVITDEDEKCGEFHVLRRHGDKYSYIDGRDYNRLKDGSATFNFGFNYVENHELIASKKETAVGNFDLKSKMTSFKGDWSEWKERENGFVEKTWGDKVAYHKGRVMFWGAGDGPGDSLQLFHYGTRYTENHVKDDKGTITDRKPEHDDGASKVGQKALIEKTFGDSYNYQSGKTSNVLVGDSYSAQYGNITKSIEGDTKFEQKGKVSNKYDGKFEELYTDKVTIKCEKDVKETLQGKKRLDITGKLDETYKNGRNTTDKGTVSETFERATKHTYKDSITKKVSGGVTEEYTGASRSIKDKMSVSETGAKMRKLQADKYDIENKMTTIKSSMIQIG